MFKLSIFGTNFYRSYGIKEEGHLYTLEEINLYYDLTETLPIIHHIVSIS
jgi:hypothetical protein